MSSLLKRSFKSKVAPKGLSFSRNHFQMGDRYVKLVTILNTPKEYYAGILSVLTSNPNIKVDMMCEPSSENIPNLIKNQVNKMEREYRETVDVTKREKISQDVTALNNMVAHLVARRDKTYNVVINVMIITDSLNELNEEYQKLKMQLSVMGWQLQSLTGIQEKLYKRTSVWFYTDGFNSEMKRKVGVVFLP